MGRSSGKGESGFGVIGLMVLIATFLVGFMAAETMRQTLHSVETHSAQLMNVENVRNNLLVLIKDSRSWAQTASYGTVGNLRVSTAAGSIYYDLNSGVNPNTGEICNGYPSQACPLRFKVVGRAMDTTSNPIIIVTVELETSEYSKGMAPEKTFFTDQVGVRPAPLEANPIVRQNNASWVTQGLMNTPRLQMYNFGNLPDCNTYNVTPGQRCLGQEGTMCQCRPPLCQLGVEIFTCG